MSPTLYQTDSRITNHRRRKLPPSLTLLSFKTRIKWPLGWPQPQVSPRVIFNSCNIQGNIQAFRLTHLEAHILILDPQTSKPLSIRRMYMYFRITSICTWSATYQSSPYFFSNLSSYELWEFDDCSWVYQ